MTVDAWSSICISILIESMTHCPIIWESKLSELIERASMYPSLGDTNTLSGFTNKKTSGFLSLFMEILDIVYLISI